MPELTGKFRMRKTMFGWKVYVEWERTNYGDAPEPFFETFWKDATVEDLIKLNINAA